ncbi:hypothetical protein HU200_062944 [Digitaria exilis]|uniref:Uncharacterized protein n=1 Tax=Digitaria exilis TaxID=1010633 RepID=A0A835DWN2_9POAL|nr:hypothetical protein HU200_062944 [Digitaria exilis]
MERPQQEPAAAAAEAAEKTMALYDACWFRCLVLLPSPPLAPPPAPELLPDHRRSPRPAASNPPNPTPTAAAGGSSLRHRRTRSDEAAAAAFQGLEPLRLPNSGNRARLETIMSGKDGLVVVPQPLPERTRRPEARRPAGRRRRRRGRSMSELEFEEVKGLQDLGFTFSDAEVDAELASIVPGLRRKRSEEENHRATASAPAAPMALREEAAAAVAATAPRRPYLSEAWDDEEEEVRRALRNWRIPPAGDGNDLKEHLRMWAHIVASAVR